MNTEIVLEKMFHGKVAVGLNYGFEDLEEFLHEGWGWCGWSGDGFRLIANNENESITIWLFVYLCLLF